MNYLITRDSSSDCLEHYGVLGMKWGQKKANYYGEGKSSFEASNGLKVGAPNSRGIAAFRKVQGSRVGGAMLTGLTKTQTHILGRDHSIRVARENQAVRESNQAHKQAVKHEKLQNKLARKANAKIDTAERYQLNSKEYKDSARTYAINKQLKGKEYTNSFMYKYRNAKALKNDKKSQKYMNKADAYIKKMTNPHVLTGIKKTDAYFDPNTGAAAMQSWIGNKVITSSQARRMKGMNN